MSIRQKFAKIRQEFAKIRQVFAKIRQALTQKGRGEGELLSFKKTQQFFLYNLFTRKITTVVLPSA